MATILRRSATAVAMLAATPAFAHHPMEGATPATAMQGLLSGIGHPIIGLDHLAFVVAIGIAGAAMRRPYATPLAFAAATLVGALVHVGAIGLPMVETVIAMSVVVLGLALASGRLASAPLVIGGAALAGLFHGHAYGEAIVGAEATPLLAYLAGFAATQWAIAVGAGFAANRLAGSLSEGVPTAHRLSGAGVFGMGLLMISERTLAAIGLA